jgi:hypothetical protein
MRLFLTDAELTKARAEIRRAEIELAEISRRLVDKSIGKTVEAIDVTVKRLEDLSFTLNNIDR